MFPATVSNYWEATEEELADLPFLARDLLDEVEVHMAVWDIPMVVSLLNELVNLSHAFDDPIMQAKIRLDVARVGHRIGSPDITRTNAGFAIGILEGTHPRFPRQDVMCGHVQNHYLAKCYYLLAILESGENIDPDLALFYLHRSQDKVSNLCANPYDHPWTGNGHYRFWDAILQREADEYARRRRRGGGGPFPGGPGGAPPPGDPGGTAPPGDPGGTAPPRDPSGGPISGGGQEIQSALPFLSIFGVRQGPLPVFGEISFEGYLSYGTFPLIPEGYARPYNLPQGTPGMNLPAAQTNRFKIRGRQYRLYDLRQDKKPLAIDPLNELYFLLRVKAVTEQLAGPIHKGDYLLLQGGGTRKTEGLLLYEKKDKGEYFYKLDRYIIAELNPPGYNRRESGEFQDEVDHAETKIEAHTIGIVIGVFKRTN